MKRIESTFRRFDSKSVHNLESHNFPRNVTPRRPTDPLDDVSWLSSLFYREEDNTEKLMDENINLCVPKSVKRVKRRRSPSDMPHCSLHSLPKPNQILVRPYHGSDSRLRLRKSGELPVFAPVNASLHSSKEDLIFALTSLPSNPIIIENWSKESLPKQLRHCKKSTRDKTEILSLENNTICGPLQMLGKGSFGYALRCFSAAGQQLVLKIDIRYNYALWDALVQAIV